MPLVLMAALTAIALSGVIQPITAATKINNSNHAASDVVTSSALILDEQQARKTLEQCVKALAALDKPPAEN